ncbi:MAG: glucose-6-phosphate isomerase [Desulfuromonadales bacterium]|nr:glucose-6-phosphate isomerase [Desulfuromonadales bacterium]
MLWQRYKEFLCDIPEIGLLLDISRMNFDNSFFDSKEPEMQKAFTQMEALEAGGIANPDENRMVGHYWLRNPAIAPTPEISAEIKFTIRAVKEFTEDIHTGELKTPEGKIFKKLLVIGIGGSALGPQFVADSLKSPLNKMTPYFFDNTDPDGMDSVLAEIGTALDETLVVVISKSGRTKETRNGMSEAKEAYSKVGLNFPKYAVAITGNGSELDKTAENEGWIARFPMWDWVGGRTSVTSAVGLLPAALQGIDIDSLLNGAKLCDIATRNRVTRKNPAAILALMWHYATGGKGKKDMVILPYKDRLLLFSRYLQQLLMESIGKEKDLSGNAVHQGLSVYGNKGSTDQHAYVQQLREGINNFFVTFIEVLKDRGQRSMMVEPEITSGDYLAGFLQGTREALSEAGRESITITVEEISPKTVGALIALYERSVGLYSFLIDVNAYHQPGVEAGKKAANTVLETQRDILSFLKNNQPKSFRAGEIAELSGKPEKVEMIFRIMMHIAANPDHNIKMEKAEPVWNSRFRS